MSDNTWQRPANCSANELWSALNNPDTGKLVRRGEVEHKELRNKRIGEGTLIIYKADLSEFGIPWWARKFVPNQATTRVEAHDSSKNIRTDILLEMPFAKGSVEWSVHPENGGSLLVVSHTIAIDGIESFLNRLPKPIQDRLQPQIRQLQQLDPNKVMTEKLIDYVDAMVEQAPDLAA